MASNKATAVRAFSPPLSKRVVEGGFPGRRGHDVHTALQNVHTFLQHDVGLTTPERLPVQLLEIGPDRLQRFGEQPPAVGVDLVDDPFQRLFGLRQVLELAVQTLVARLQIVQLVQGFHVDRADVADLAFEPGDLLLHRLALPDLFLVRFIHQFRDLNSVVLAEPIDQSVAFVADFPGGQITFVEFVAELTEVPLLRLELFARVSTVARSAGDAAG